MNEREFGYLPFGGGMVRHIAYSDMGELLAMLVKEGPSAVYSSNSYYLEPSLPMHEKGWKGADLIFDIDADVLMLPCRKEHDTWVCRQCMLQEFGVRPETCPRCHSSRISEQNWGCKNCIGATKDETFKLLDIIEQDFGIPKSEISVYFSGSLGFHISVESNNIEDLDNLARTEIGEYVSGKGVLVETFGIRPKFSVEQFLDDLPSLRDPGWRGRMARYFRDLKYDDNDIRIDGSDVREKIKLIYKKEKYVGFLKVTEQGLRKMGASVDPSVTMDIHRIFRLGGTLNGKTGLLKMKCDGNLEGFEPLADAVVLGNEKIKVYIDFAPWFELKEQGFGPYRSEAVELPAFVAVYLMCKGAATVRSQ